MRAAKSIRTAALLSMVAGTMFVAGCNEEKPAPPPTINVTAPPPAPPAGKTAPANAETGNSSSSGHMPRFGETK